MRVLVFLHGTAIMHPGAEKVSREERVRAVVERHPSVYDFTSYVPTPGAVAKIAEWSRRGEDRVLQLGSSSRRHRGRRGGAAAARRAIRCIVLPEFLGFEELPGDPSQLLRTS